LSCNRNEFILLYTVIVQCYATSSSTLHFHLLQAVTSVLSYTSSVYTCILYINPIYFCTQFP